MSSGISVLGIKMDLGRYKRGADYGPEAIRRAGLLSRLENYGFKVEDFGDLKTKFHDNKQVGSDISAVAKEFEQVAKKIMSICASDRFFLILGGDHSISIATIAGISSFYKNLGVIWFDAHADLNTPETSPTGNIYGMSLAVNLGYGYPQFLKVGYIAPKVKRENVVLIGVRELDPGESKFIKEQGIKVYTMDDISQMGIKKVITEALRHLEKNCDHIHLSFDLDALDPVHVPGLRTPCEKGVSLSDAILAMKVMGRSARARTLISVEFVEMNPFFDIDQQTAENTVRLAEELFGEYIF